MANKERRAKSLRHKNHVFGTLRERISAHTLLPGSKLQEHALAKEFKLSRAHVRELLASLEARGLIERIPNRGAVVAGLDINQAINLYYVREALEGMCARLAAENSVEHRWDDLIEQFEGPLDVTIRKGEFDIYMKALKQLNNRLIEDARNPILADILDRIYDRTYVMQRRIIVLAGRAQVGLEMHRDLLRSLAEADGGEAEAIKRKIIATAREQIDRYKNYIF